MKLLFFLCIQFLLVTVKCLSTSSSSKMKSLTHIEGILFDMDGTLLETESLGCKAVYLTLKNQMSEEARQGFKERNYRMEWELKQQTLGLPDRKWPFIVFDWAQKHWGVKEPPTVDDFLERWDTNMFEHMPGVEKCPGAKDIVTKLAERKLPLAIATSSRAKAVEQKRKRHEDIFEKIDTIVTGDDPSVKNGKPAPDIYLEAAKRLGVQPDKCVVFEDSMTGALAGKRAECFVVAVPDPRSSEEEKAKFREVADLVLLEDLNQFHDLVALP